ncbi:MAG TPA: asparagine synthase (glutamine-hydrolyzing) [Casimicrobiaceae bacterium]
MCGIAGFWRPAAFAPREELEHDALAMARAIAHRGPDFQAAWADSALGIAFGHARLSIIDLSAAANQPMHAISGRYTIVFNGEIYNFRTLRDELRATGYEFRTAGDTEVIPAAVHAWGIEKAVQRLNGIFAFALWDAANRVLHLVRDHVGVKPLYYGVLDGTLMFGSTLKALFAYPGFDAKVDASALAAYLRYCYVPGPRSMLRGVSKLSPGSIVSFDSSLSPRATRYWDVVAEAGKGTRDPLRGNDEELSRAFEALAMDAVRGQLVSDVPLGAFLSGGIDSSLVTALMQASAPGNVKTFTIGFEDTRFDESPQAREVARHLGTQHTEMACTTREARDIIPELPHFFDEPFADSSQIPTMLLSGLTRRHVTVALSGDGGDELFAGYDRYSWMYRLRRLKSRLPSFAARWIGALAALAPRGTTFPVIARIAPSPERWLVRIDALYHLARMLERYDDYAYLYRTTPMSVATLRDGALLGDESEPAGVIDDARLRDEFPDVLDWMQLVDQKTYMVDDILHKVDRASMAYGLEARVPLLDRRLVEFSWRVPQAMKADSHQGKRLMRSVLQRYLPRHLIDRPKRGFSIPLADWLRRELRDWAESMLSPRLLARDGLLDAAGVRRCWTNFLTGQANHTQTTIWALLMFLAWRENYGR